jgi:spermidine synthase
LTSAAKKKFWVCLLALGVSSVSVQFVMIREIMSSFGGNELVIGLVLAMWLLCTGLGSAFGVVLAKRGNPEKTLFSGHLLVAVLPFFQLTAMRALPLFWVRGQMLGLTSAIFGSTLVLMPFCLVAGAMIPVAGSLWPGKDAPSKVYVSDTLGDIGGGLLFTLVLVHLLSHWDSLVVLGILNVAAAFLMLSTWWLPVLCMLALGMAATRTLDTRALSWRFPGQEIVLNKNTPFAQLTISKTGNQINVLQDAIPLFSTGDLDAETLVHLPLCQVVEGSRVLLLAGGVFGSIAEIAKHHPSRVDYVELDPAILELDELIGRSLRHPSVHTHLGDGRLFVKKAATLYDVIIVDLPDPENAQLNRFYTKEFFEETMSILKQEGVLSFSLTGSENYLEEKGLALNRSVYAALKETFRHVIVFPGITHYYLASNSPLDPGISAVLARRGIRTERLVDYDLPTMTDPFRMETLGDLLAEKEVSSNRDLSPLAFGHLMDLWMKKSGSSKTILYAAVAAILVFFAAACRKDRLRFTIASSGYAGMAFELSLLLLFQVIYGYVYVRICLFITLYLIGSAVGAWMSARIGRSASWQVLVCDAGLIVLAGLAAIAATVGPGLRGGPALLLMNYMAIPGLLFLVAFTAGCQFSAVSRLARGIGAEITGRLYVSDLAGAACGTILTALVFLPKMGILGVLISLAALKGLSLAANVLAARSPSQCSFSELGG